MSPASRCRYALLLTLAFAATACEDGSRLTGTPPPEEAAPARISAEPPTPLVSVSLGGVTRQIWPYTEDNFDGAPSDPINLIFIGNGDARNVRAALMSLDGSRTGALAPFTCTWTDAIGANQAAYTASSGWRGSVIQLECGSYVPFRFHVRLFPVGDVTLANAHVDVIVSGTEAHQVISWELGEQLVAYDLARSGLLAAAPAATGTINSAPTFREIPPLIYNALPVELRALAGGPLVGNVNTGVGIATDGSAMVFSLATAPAAPGTSQRVELTYGQFIPKPLCSTPGTLIRVDGPLVLELDVRVAANGALSSQVSSTAELTIRPFDPTTGTLGDPAPAVVRYHATTQANAASNLVHATRMMQLSTGRAPEQLFEEFRVGSGGPAHYRSDERCR